MNSYIKRLLFALMLPSLICTKTYGSFIDHATSPVALVTYALAASTYYVHHVLTQRVQPDLEQAKNAAVTNCNEATAKMNNRRDKQSRYNRTAALRDILAGMTFCSIANLINNETFTKMVIVGLPSFLSVLER